MSIKPWTKSKWETTQKWQNLIQELEWDIQINGYEDCSPRMKELLQKFFDKALNRR